MQRSNLKVDIITFHFVNNFGGALQAYALQKTISECFGAECEVIDYKNWFITFTDTIRLLPITTNLKEIAAGFKTMGLRFERVRMFRDFVLRTCKLTRLYRNYLTLKFDPPVADKYVCGSDQIWNPILTMGVSRGYFLRFVAEKHNRIAYAPSFGTDRIPNLYKKIIKKYLKGIGYLSVRESSGQMMIRQLTGSRAEQLIDPIFLLEKWEWEKLGNNPRNGEDYILLYIMQRDMKVYEYARKIKEKLKVKLIEISRYGYNPGFVDECLINVGPAEFLGLFRDARYICTNSYHGLAYSIIFEKEFCLIPCKRFKARINNLLRLLRIETGNEYICEGRLTAAYDKEFVKGTIVQEREKAIHYLRKCITSGAKGETDV